MNTKLVLTTSLILGGIAVAGCMKSETDPSPATEGMKGMPPAVPATKPAKPPAVTVVLPVPATKPAEAPKAKEMTHVLVSEQPCYMSPGAPTCGTLAKGTKVLLVIPGDMAQVETSDGKTVYTKSDALQTVAEAAATHVLSKDQPYFKSMPGEGAKPSGTLKAGTKMLLLIPGSMAQVQTTSGQTVYTPIDGIDLIPMKK